MLIEGFELNLSDRDVCKITKDSMHESVIKVIESNLGSEIFEKPFYAFYKDISGSMNADEFNVQAKDFHDYDLLIAFAKHIVKTTGVRYDISYIYTPDDEKFYIVHEDDFE